MIIKINELEQLNIKMLGLGAPTEKDDSGYNKPDYSKCREIRFGISNSQAALLCDVLKKYTKTQIQTAKSDLIESEDHYNKLSGSKMTINIVYHDEMSSIHNKYDVDVMNVIRSAKNRKWNGIEKCWYVANNEVCNILDKLVGLCDVENARKYFLENYKITEASTTVVKPAEKIKVAAIKTGNMIEIIASYHAGIVAAIKSLDNRKYNPDNKSWKVSIDEVGTLIKKLRSYENEIDFTSLIQHEIIVEVREITLKELTNNKVNPFNHQLEAARFLLENKKAILADEMGGGKTLSAIIAADNVIGKKLIICPASLKLNWEKEIVAMDNTAKVGIINGKTIQDLGECDWYIINYDILSKQIDSIIDAKFKVCIFDEAHYIKSINNSGKATSGRGKNSLKIAGNCEYCFMLTGTPITNKAKDIFNLCKAVDHTITNNWYNFGMKYCAGYKDRYGYNFDGYSNASELHEKLQNKMMRRLKSELLDLPSKTRSFIPSDINIKEYDKKFNEYMADRKHITAGEALVRLNGLRHILAVEKIPHTIDMIENLLEQDKKVIVFTCYTEVANQIVEKFNAKKITGDCSSQNRQDTVDEFQSGNINVLVCNIQAAGVGLTLTNSDTVIFNDFDWTPANHLQAEDRIHRIGQNKSCNIYYMYANNAFMDTKMSQIIEYKITNINNIIDDKNESMFDQIK